MSKKGKHVIVAELPPTQDGAYARTDAQGRDVRGDPSGEWVLDDEGEVEDIVFFVSPGFLRQISD